ncbi:MAG: helix-turn-helix transcriptional regulator [Candidatus Acidiferrum sp.]
MSGKCHSILFDQRGHPLGQVASVSADLADGYTIPLHFHPEDQLIFASKGVMTLRTDQGIWVVPPMRAVWIPAETPHSVAMSGQVSMRTLYFLPRLVKGLPKKCFVMNVTPLLRELILHACTFKRLNKKAPVQKRILEIIVDQLQAVHSIPLQLPHPVDARAMRIVQALLANPGERCNLNKLCKDCGASKRTIERIFLSETKLTFGKWRQQLRLLHALQLLASGEKVTGAALDAGYGSTSAFISMFKKQLGATPTRYFQGWGTNDDEKSIRASAQPLKNGSRSRRRESKHESFWRVGNAQGTGK